MPIDLEMLLSATRPTLFTFSPFADDRFPWTSSYGVNDYSSSRNPFLRTNSRRFGFIPNSPEFVTYKTRTDLKSSKGKNSSEESTRKKKVSFADDRGLNLVQVREIPGAPKWTEDVMALLIGGTQENVVPQKTWKPASEHPPWEDEKLVELLEKNKVVLESVIVKRGSGDVLSGTIKLKNLAYEKNVFVRITFDRWLSYDDIKADFMKRMERSLTKPNEYDTFRFNAKIPPSAMKYGVIEFCVCFQCCGRGFWDNNGGINYRLMADSSNESSTVHRSDEDKLSDSKITFSLTENIENFSEIDAWSSFMYHQPYW